MHPDEVEGDGGETGAPPGQPKPAWEEGDKAKEGEGTMETPATAQVPPVPAS